MKALTICQPYAHLICLPETDPRHKRVENRTWPTNYRGPLAIHAGKSRDWLTIERGDNGMDWDANYELEVAGLDFGAVIATATLVACVRMSDSGHLSPKAETDYPWLRTHQHANGPWCWILDDVKRLPAPVSYRGAQGLFDIPDSVLVSA